MLVGLAILLLLALAYTGIRGAIDQFSNAENTPAQLLQTSTQLAFGVASLALIGSWFWRPQWSRAVSLAFVVALGLAGGLAPVVWAHQGIGIGVVSGVASALVAWGIVWLLRFGANGKRG